MALITAIRCRSPHPPAVTRDLFYIFTNSNGSQVRYSIADLSVQPNGSRKLR